MPEGREPEVVDTTAREWALEAQGAAREASQRVDSYVKVSEEKWAAQRREWEAATRHLVDIRQETKEGIANLSTKMDRQHAENRADMRQQTDALRSDIGAVNENVREIEVKFEVDKEEKKKDIIAVDRMYNARFWQLACGVIATLVLLCGALAAHMFFK